MSLPKLTKEHKRFLRDYPVPKGTLCGSCGSTNVVRRSMILAGPRSGSLLCVDCGHFETVYAYLARNAFSEPLGTDDANG